MPRLNKVLINRVRVAVIDATLMANLERREYIKVFSAWSCLDVTYCLD